MALQEYIIYEDIHHILWNKLKAAHTDVLQIYINKANDKVEDRAVVLEVDVLDIAFPLHPTFKEYAINYALMLFAKDRIGANNNSGIDIYKALFETSIYMLKDLKKEVTIPVITKENQDFDSRAISFGTRIR